MTRPDFAEMARVWLQRTTSITSASPETETAIAEEFARVWQLGVLHATSTSQSESRKDKRQREGLALDAFIGARRRGETPDPQEYERRFASAANVKIEATVERFIALRHRVWAGHNVEASDLVFLIHSLVDDGVLCSAAIYPPPEAVDWQRELRARASHLEGDDACGTGPDDDKELSLLFWAIADAISNDEPKMLDALAGQRLAARRAEAT